MNKFAFSGTIDKLSVMNTKSGQDFGILQVTHGGVTLEFSVFGHRYENAREFKKGQEVMVEGTLTSRSYTDKLGAQRYGINLQADSLRVKKTEGDSARETDDDVDAIPF